MKLAKILFPRMGAHPGATIARCGTAIRARRRVYNGQALGHSQRVSKEVCMRINVLPFVLSSPQGVSKDSPLQINARRP